MEIIDTEVLDNMTEQDRDGQEIEMFFGYKLLRKLIEKKFPISALLATLTLLSACAPSSAQPSTPVVPPDLKECLEDTPNVEWSGDIQYVPGKTSSARFLFDQEREKVIITEILIASSLTPEEEKIVLEKELCGHAYVLESLAKGCVLEWGDPPEICMSERAMIGMVDAFALSYLREEQQRLILPEGVPILHLPVDQVNFSCSDLETFQIWSERGVILPGDWPYLLSKGNCN